MEDITIDAGLALGLLRLLDQLCDGGFLAYYVEDELDARAEAAALGRRLLDRMERPFADGAQVVLSERPTASPGTVVGQVLFADGWEIHVEWPDEGVGISSAGDLVVVAPEAP